MFFYIKIFSKEKKNISKFINFLSKTSLFKFVELNQISNKKKRKFVTILKSPHVNKTAQEQFELRVYSKHILIFSSKPFLSFFILKKLKLLTFSGINLKIKYFFQKKYFNKRVLSVLNPDNVKITQSKKLNYKYLELFDCFGEVSLKNKFKNHRIFSSVG